MADGMSILVTFTNKAAAGLRGLRNNLDRLDRSADQSAKKLNSIGTAVSGLVTTIAGGAFLKSAVSTFASFDDSMRAAGAVTNATTEEMKMMTDIAKKMGATTSFSATQAAEALQLLGMAGLSAQEATAALPSILNLAAVGAMDLGTAADIATNILTGYGKEVSELAGITDILAKAFTSANVTLPEMGEAFKEVGSFAKSSGADFEELTATIGVLGNAGIKGSKAGTSLKNALAALLKPTKAQADMQKQLAARIGQTSLRVKDSEGNFIGFAAVIEQLEDAGMDGSEAMEAFGMIAGPEMAALLTQGSDKLKELTKELKNANGTASALAKQMEAGLGGELRRTKSAMEAVKLVFGEAISQELIQFLQVLQDKFADVIDKVNSLASQGAFDQWGDAAILALDGITFAVEKLWNGLNSLVKLNLAAAFLATGDLEAAKLAYLGFEDDLKKIIGTYEEVGVTGQSVTKAITAEMYAAKDATKAVGDETKKASTAAAEFTEVIVGYRANGEAIIMLERNTKKVTAATEASADEIKNFEKEAKKAYKQAKDYAKEYADQVIEFEKKIQDSKRETDDTIRELNRKGMTDLEEWNDKKKEAEEKLSEAKRALAQGDFELAETLANQSKELYVSLAADVKDGNGAIVKSLDDTKKVAIAGVKEVGSFSEDMYSQQKKNAENSEKTWKSAMAEIEKQLDEIAKDKKAKITITLEGLSKAKSDITALTKDEHKTIYVKTVQTEKDGGMIYGFSTGQYIPRKGALPGYGGGDKVKALLEPGEGILRKEAMDVIGKSQLDDWNALRFNLGGAVPGSSATSQNQTSFGKIGNGPGEMLTLRFQAGDEESSVNVMDNNSDLSMRLFAEKLEKMRLTYVQ